MSTRDLPPSTGCFVCGRDNPRGLGLRFHHHAAGPGHAEAPARVSASLTLEHDYHGFSDRAHGGIVAAVLDEAMGWATSIAGRRFTYTVELAVRYLQPVPTGVELTVVGWVTRQNRRLLRAVGELRDDDGIVLASGEGRFVPVSEEESRRIDASLLYEPGAERISTTSSPW